MSTPQTIPVQTVFDYVYDEGGVAIYGAHIYVTLQYNQGVNVTPQASIAPVRYKTETDTNGYWSFSLAPNPNLTPTGTTYLITTPYNSYEISLPASGGPFQATSILVNTPTVLTPSTSTVGALTVTGLLQAEDGLTVTGTVTLPAASLSEGNVANLTADLANRPLTSTVVLLAGSQTITGNKDFTAGETISGGLVVDTITESGNQTVGGTLGVTGATTTTGVITANGGILDYTKFKARMYLSSVPSYTYNTVVKVPLNQVTYDPNSNTSTSSNNWTCPQAGYYWINGNASASTSGSETLSVLVLIYKNGSELVRSQDASGTLAASSNLGSPVSTLQLLASGDVIDMRLFQVNSLSANLAGPTGSNAVYLEVHYMSS